MVYFTGDIHGNPTGISLFCNRNHLKRDDIVILLGDVGANYYGGIRDHLTKSMFAELSPTFLCIHGNHEQRPAQIAGYHLVEWHGGHVWVQDKYPNLLFAKDGDIFTIENHRYLVIGGAYSVDKYYRLQMHWGWWPDEQPSVEIKALVEEKLATNDFDVILSHTCPQKYIPYEMFLPQIDQSTVDASTEIWLDSIEERVKYTAWFCGHWHTNKRIDKMHFLFDEFESEDNIMSYTAEED